MGPLAEPQCPDVPSARAGRHIPELDGVRGLAILLVLFTHFLLEDRSTLASRLLSDISSIGWTGVDLFFVLSGFLITGILYDAKGAVGFFRIFYARRTLRIFPLYYGVLLVTLVIGPAICASWCRDVSAIASHQWSLWLYCSNIDIAVHHDWIYRSPIFEMDHFWSLAVEEQFYLIWPLFVAVLGRRSLMHVCIGASLLALALRFYWAIYASTSLTFYVLMPCRMDALACGAFVALAARGPGGLAAILPRARRVFILAGGVVVAIYLQFGMWSPGVLSVRTIGMLALAVFFAAGLAPLLAAGRNSIPRRIFSAAWLRFLGKYSYGLYVFHALLIPLLCRWMPMPAFQARLHSPALGQLGYFVCASVISLIVAVLSWQLYERHFLALKRFFRARPGGFDKIRSSASFPRGAELPATIPEFAVPE